MPRRPGEGHIGRTSWWPWFATGAVPPSPARQLSSGVGLSSGADRRRRHRTPMLVIVVVITRIALVPFTSPVALLPVMLVSRNADATNRSCPPLRHRRARNDATNGAMKAIAANLRTKARLPGSTPENLA